MKIKPCFIERSEDVEIRIHCQPRASKTEIVGMHGDSLKVRLAAPPVDGAANIKLCQFLSEYFGVSQQNVKILSGHRSRKKRVLIQGKTVLELQKYLT